MAVKLYYILSGYLERTFGKFKVKHIEYKIKHPLSDYPQTFKGFIDLVLELENGKIIIADFKTASSSFFFKKYKDKYKDYQIILYKKFYSEIEKVKLEDIDTCFIVFEKNIETKKPVDIIDIGSTDKKIKNSEEWLNHTLRLINQQKFIKDFSKCFKYGENYPCVFYGTSNCSRR